MEATERNVIGEELLSEIVTNATRELLSRTRYDFEPYECVYRLNDCGDYVSEEDWDSYWSAFQKRHEMAWMLSDNGKYTEEEVSEMTIEEVETAYNSPDFYPEYAFCTEADGDGNV